MNNDNNAYNNFTSQNYSGLSKFLDSLDAYEFAMIGVITAFLIAPALTVNEQNSIGNFLEEVGQILLTIATQAQNIQGINNNSTSANVPNSAVNPNVSSDIESLRQELEELRNMINNRS